MSVLPKLGDLEFYTYKFDAGNRILARVSVDLSTAQRHKIFRAVQKSMGDVRLLIINIRNMRIVKQGVDGRILSLTGSPHQDDRVRRGLVHLSCSAIDLDEGDVLIVFVSKLSFTQKNLLLKNLREWAGEGVEIRLEETESFWKEQRNTKNFIGKI